MGNLSKIIKFSKFFHFVVTFMLAAMPLYYIVFWSMINHLPTKLVTVNIQRTPLIPHELPIELQLIGFMICLLPMSALMYGLANIRKLFSFYREGIIFSPEHVIIFKKTAQALLLWVVLSMIYESAKSVLFSLGNPPGQRILEVGIGTAEITSLLVGGIVFVVAWVMDEGRVLNEENELTV